MDARWSSGAGHGPSGSGERQTAAEQFAQHCKETHELKPIKPLADVLANLESDCSLTHCGTNGAWLGEGVPFRELHLKPERGDAETFSVIEFRDKDGNLLDIHMDRDVLSGTPKGGGVALKGTQLVDSVLSIGRAVGTNRDVTSNTTIDYTITIKEVKPMPFWTECDGCAPEFSIYTLVAMSAGDQCPVQMCAPGLDDNKPASIAGTVTMFRGDLYTDHHDITDQTPGTNRDDVFNVACMGTAIAKLELLRYTSAAQHPDAVPAPTIDQRKAMLRLMTADYCGTGNPFTIDGLPIKLGIDRALLKLTTLSEYIYQTPLNTDKVDAVWNGDRATCVSHPRNDVTIDRINEVCDAHQAPHVKECDEDPAVDLHNLFPWNSHAISVKPQ